MQEAVDQEVALADLEAGESITFDMPMTVSYTHLDVYKRQIIDSQNGIHVTKRGKTYGRWQCESGSDFYYLY